MQRSQIKISIEMLSLVMCFLFQSARKRQTPAHEEVWSAISAYRDHRPASPFAPSYNFLTGDLQTLSSSFIEAEILSHHLAMLFAELRTMMWNYTKFLAIQTIASVSATAHTLEPDKQKDRFGRMNNSA